MTWQHIAAEAAFCFAGFLALVGLAWSLYVTDGWRD